MNLGFGEFTDEADIAFWTGILGELNVSVTQLYVLTPIYSRLILPYSVSDLAALGITLSHLY